ncbi:MAG: hypothetical protein JO034_30395 [Singulisphaera sp.]|nr:hypothetical protein [Singulisphaera sp.]
MDRSMNHGDPSFNILIILDWMLRIEQAAAFVEGDRESDPEAWGPEWDLFGWAPTIARDDKGDDDEDSDRPRRVVARRIAGNAPAVLVQN